MLRVKSLLSCVARKGPTICQDLTQDRGNFSPTCEKNVSLIQGFKPPPNNPITRPCPTLVFLTPPIDSATHCTRLQGLTPAIPSVSPAPRSPPPCVVRCSSPRISTPTEPAPIIFTFRNSAAEKHKKEIVKARCTSSDNTFREKRIHCFRKTWKSKNCACAKP